MRSRCFCALVAAMGILTLGQCWGQDVALSFDGPCGDEITGAPGSAHSMTLDCVLTTSNNPGDAGAQGWSISVASEGGTITGITTEGTVAADVAQGGMRSVGFEKTETTIRSGITPGGANDCDGLLGAVSAVVLSFVNPVTLDPEGSAVIAKVDVESETPNAPGDCSTVEVFFGDGCRGAGQPVRNAVTLNASTFIPELGRCSTTLCAARAEDCSARGDEDGNGLADCDDPACAEDPACVSVDVSLGFGGCSDQVSGEPGENYSSTIDCTLTASNNEFGVGAQGWSVSIAAEGTTISSITTDGTAGADVADGGLRSVGFEKSQTTSEAGAGSACEGFNGAVSAVVLSFTMPVTLRAEGTSVIAKIDVGGRLPADAGSCSAGSVFYANGCQGAGQPVANAITINAQTRVPTLGRCSFDACAEEGDGGLAEFELAFSGENSETIEGVYGLTFNQTIDCTLTTTENRTEVGAQGWSISLAGDPGLDIIGITVDGTTAADEDEGGLRRGGFEKTELTEGEANEGAVSAVVLSFTELVTLPPAGTAAIARIDIQCPFPEVDVTETKVVRYVDGRSGAGQPVDNVITHENFGVLPDKTAYEVTLLGIDENAVTYDCNTDGRVNIADAQCLLNWLFLGGPAPGCQDAMNFNGDSRLNIADGISGLNFLFLGGPPPASGTGCQPYPDCDLQDACAI